MSLVQILHNPRQKSGGTTSTLVTLCKIFPYFGGFETPLDIWEVLISRCLVDSISTLIGFIGFRMRICVKYVGYSTAGLLLLLWLIVMFSLRIYDWGGINDQPRLSRKLSVGACQVFLAGLLGYIYVTCYAFVCLSNALTTKVLTLSLSIFIS